MAATKTVAHRLRVRKSSVAEILAASPHLGITPRFGIVTLFGYGIQVRVDRGHLILEDGIGADRRYARFPRVAHGLDRLVTIGSDGMVSLAALRWLADQNASFVMLDREGSVLVATGAARKGDVHLRRAQALARQSGAGMQITRDLIDRKLLGQEQVARNQLGDSAAADAIGKLRLEIPSLSAFDTIRLLESQAGACYWAAWRSVQIQFPRQDLPRVPNHWRTFQARRSPVSGSPRLAANPVNAILNYLYAIVEAEARLAAAVLGLDPGFGFLHADAAHRDSLAADMMEPVRPQVDAFVLDWILREPIKRESEAQRTAIQGSLHLAIKLFRLRVAVLRRRSGSPEQPGDARWMGVCLKKGDGATPLPHRWVHLMKKRVCRVKTPLSAGCFLPGRMAKS